jgi:signal recognition particle GTPase
MVETNLEPLIVQSKSELKNFIGKSYCRHVGEPNSFEQMRANFNMLFRNKNAFSERMANQYKRVSDEVFDYLEKNPLSSEMAIEYVKDLENTIARHKEEHSALPVNQMWHEIDLNVIGPLPEMVKLHDFSENEAKVVVAVYDLLTNRNVQYQDLLPG